MSKRQRRADDAGTSTDASKRVKKTPKKTDDQPSIYDVRDGSKESIAAGDDWQRQYMQGKSTTDLPALGCGLCTLGSPWVPSQYPSRDETSLEVMTGGDPGPGGVGLRLIGPRGYYRLNDVGRDSDFSDACFLVPFAHMEQVLVLPIPPLAKPASKSKAKRKAKTKATGTTTSDDYHRVVIIPTAATGCSPIFRTYPQIISFSWPGTRSVTDGSLSGKHGEAAAESSNPEETYLSVFKRAFDEQLDPYDKSVIDLTAPDESQKESINIPTTISFRKTMNEAPNNIAGHISLLPTGAIIFISNSHRLYFPQESIKSGFMMIRAFKLADHDMQHLLAIDLLLSDVGEPFFKNVKETTTGGQPTSTGSQELGGGNSNEKPDNFLIMFKAIPAEKLDVLQAYVDEHRIEATHCHQVWYDYAEGHPTTGFMPDS